MRRADRLFQIVQYLRGGRLVRARQLSEWLEVSERTIYRDVADLQASGVPIEGAAGVGYIMRDGYELPPLMFTRDEIVALLAGARLIRAWGGAAMARAAEEAMIKIDAVLPEKMRVRQNEVEIHAFAPEMTPQIRAHIDFLEAAADGRKRLFVAYCDSKGEPTDRTIRPSRTVVLGQGLDAGGLVRNCARTSACSVWTGFPRCGRRETGLIRNPARR